MVHVPCYMLGRDLNVRVREMPIIWVEIIAEHGHSTEKWG